MNKAPSDAQAPRITLDAGLQPIRVGAGAIQAEKVGGIACFRQLALLIAVASMGAGLAAEVGAARLLFGMGRDGVISRRFFAYLHPDSKWERSCGRMRPAT